MAGKGLKIVGLLLVACLAEGIAFAGTTAEIKGRVYDPEGRPLPGVTIVVRNDGLSLGERGAVTDADGRYRILQLPPGRGYRVRASLSTYAPVEFSDIELRADQAYLLDVSLRLASDLQQTIRVRGESQVVNVESVTTSTSFTSSLISGLPVLGRDYQDILTLAPGVTDVNGTGNPNVHGARDTGIVTLVDGVSTTDPFTGYYGQQLNIESIAEIQVITAGAPAEYSRAQGGFANIITKSGGNEFQGTFKYFMRTSKLDGDGAGVDDPELHYGQRGSKAFTDLQFADYYPFLSFSGPVVKDHAWYYVTGEYVQVQVPHNDLNQAFVTTSKGYRGFGKLTWQANPANKVTFSLDLDHTVDDNQGITSLTDIGSGYTLSRGGPTYTLKETAVFGPEKLLDSSLSWFDSSFERTPTTNPDTNHNGILYVDWNHDGVFQATERDPGEDYDRDRRYDISENSLGDVDSDGRLTPYAGCEGFNHEDLNCDGYMNHEIDQDLDGKVDPEEDTGLFCNDPYRCNGFILWSTRGNGKFDTEDMNGNGVLDVTGTSGQTPYPFWVDKNHNGRPDTGEFQAPLPPDQESYVGPNGISFGADPLQYKDHRKRISLREDFSLFLPELAGTHEVKIGAIYEHEGFDSDTLRRAKVNGGSVETGWPQNVNNTAVGDNVGLYIQDTYKPLPNLTLGLGIRFDVENLRSFGFQSFNPAAERDQFDQLLLNTGSLGVVGGINEIGLCGDPLYNGCSDPRLAPTVGTLKALLPGRLTRHNSEFDIQSANLAGVLGHDVTLADLLAAGINIRQPEDIRWTNNNLAPRISLSWDPRADGRSKAFASWNRYYDKLFLNSLVLEEGPDILSRFYTIDSDGISNSGLPDNQLGRAVSQAAPTIYQVSRNLSTPYTNELTLGYQRELAPEVSVSVTYIRRDYKNELQDVDINHHTRMDPLTGKPADLIGDLPTGCQISCSQVPDGLPDLYIENFLFNQILFLGNTNNQTYRGYELELVRRLSRKWQMQASYTFSKSLGDAETFLSNLGNDASLAEYESGYMDFDQRHVVKFNAIAWLPRDWKLGGVAQWASGLPYSIIVNRTALDDVGYSQNRLLYGQLGAQGFDREGRNMHRNKAVYDFSARVEKAFVLGKASASAFFEVFNLLNSDDLRVNTIESKQLGVAVNGQISDYAASHIFAVDGERRFGRHYEFGMKIDF